MQRLLFYTVTCTSVAALVAVGRVEGVRIIERPVDFAILTFAVAHADASRLTSRPWTIHPPWFAIASRQVAPSTIIDKPINGAVAVVAYAVVALLLQVILYSGVRPTVGVSDGDNRTAAVAGSVLAFSASLFPGIAVCGSHFSEDVIATVAALALFLSCEHITARSRFWQAFGLMVASSAMLCCVHAYGPLIVGSICAAEACTLLLARSSNVSVTSCARVCIGCVAIIVFVLLGAVLDWTAPSRWYEIRNNYWAHSALVWHGQLPLARIGPLVAAQPAFAGAATWVANAVIVSVVVVAVARPLMRVVFPALCLVLLAVVFVTAEYVGGRGIVLDQHCSPLVSVCVCCVGRAAGEMSTKVLGSLAALSVLFAGAPSIVAKSQPIADCHGAEVLTVVGEEIRESSDGFVAIAGSRLFFLLTSEAPWLIYDHRTRVYVPEQTGRDVSPGRFLVPDEMRCAMCPLEEVTFDSGVYLQMAGSQMTRCSLRGWELVSFRTWRHCSPSVLEIYCARVVRGTSG